MEIALLFAVSFVVARVLVRVEAHVPLLVWINERSHHRPARLLFGVMAVTFAVSSVVPNLVTVIAVMPVVARIVNGIVLPPEERRRIMTVLGLGVIYAANIGGVASLIGSPLNGLLFVALAQLDSPERHVLGFGRWLAFGLPMALVLLAAAWGVLAVLARRTLALPIGELVLPEVAHRRDLRNGVVAAGVGVIGCLGAGVAGTLFDHGAPVLRGLTVWDLAQACLALAYVLGLLVVRLPDSRARLLRVTDLWHGIPLRGVAYAFAAVGVGYALDRLGAVDALLDALRSVMPAETSQVAALVVLIPVAVVASELLSNTATALALWTFSGLLAEAGGYPVFPLAVGVALASTSAFMSPIATPATGMVFGGMRGMNLRTMVGCGAVLDAIAAVWIVACSLWWIPWVVGW